jgi:hypothetical protein
MIPVGPYFYYTGNAVIINRSLLSACLPRASAPILNKFPVRVKRFLENNFSHTIIQVPKISPGEVYHNLPGPLRSMAGPARAARRVFICELLQPIRCLLEMFEVSGIQQQPAFRRQHAQKLNQEIYLLGC